MHTSGQVKVTEQNLMSLSQHILETSLLWHSAALVPTAQLEITKSIQRHVQKEKPNVNINKTDQGKKHAQKAKATAT